MRAVMAPSGRCVQPLSATATRTTYALKLQLPTIVRWAVTDSVLTFAVGLGSKRSTKSWNNIIASWESSGYIERMREQASFYKPIEERVKKYLESL
mmetsp:Transcript_44762/g.77542  ORF Transcript_44762/g.77542 Transcript_44762/m.77542 type:complete len:96 (+) Transcript_44762:2-289(+)